MKKTLLFATALLCSAMTFAQENLALNGTATASVNSETAGLSCDGNNGSRWEAPNTFFGKEVDGEYIRSHEETDATWTLDLGEAKTFNTIQILWEGAFSKSFKIEVSTNGEEFNEIVNVTDQATAGEHSYKFDAVEAQYIKFTNVERATQWGVSFFEFRVYNMDAATLKSIELTAANNIVKTGTGVALTAQGKDQIGQNMEAGEVTYEVVPAENGTVTDGVYTPVKPGEATIVAKVGDITSNAVTVTAYAGEKINLFADYSSMVTPIGEGTKTESMVGAFDDNMGSLWEIYGGSADVNYETGFVIDLQALYDITAISATFEGACPADYAISFAGSDKEFTEAHAVEGHPGMATFTDFFTADAKEVRYVKFLSTKAATGYGIKIFDFSVYGENKQDIPDEKAPTDFTATVVEDAATISSVTLNLKATDDVSDIVYEITYNKEGAEPVAVTTTGESGVEKIYVLGGLEAGTEYAVSVVAKDAKGNAVDAISFTAKTKDMPEAAADPTVDEANAMSVYSDKYGNAEAYNPNPDWGQATKVTEIELGTENKSLMLSNLNYQGMEFNVMDVTDMEALHIDVYPVTETKLTIVPIWRNIEAAGNYAEKEYVIDNMTAGEWNAIDIPMTAFESEDRNGTNNVYQIKLVAANAPTFIIDNIYFYKSGVVDTEAPVIESAEATAVADKTATITVKATDNNELGTLTYTVKNGEEELATKKAKAGEEVTIDIKGLVPETAYELTVSVKDAAGNESETKNVEFTTLPKIEQPTSGEGSIIIQNDVITEPQTLKYTWSIAQNKTTVTLTIKVTDDTNVTGLVKENANIDTWTNETANAEANDVLTYTWDNLVEGDVLKAKIWWAVAGGRAETTEIITYTIEDTEIVTAIDKVNVATPTANDAIYNLAGQRVSKATKGIYIINGKKVIIK